MTGPLRHNAHQSSDAAEAADFWTFEPGTVLHTRSGKRRANALREGDIVICPDGDVRRIVLIEYLAPRGRSGAPVVTQQGSSYTRFAQDRHAGGTGVEPELRIHFAPSGRGATSWPDRNDGLLRSPRYTRRTDWE